MGKEDKFAERMKARLEEELTKAGIDVIFPTAIPPVDKYHAVFNRVTLTNESGEKLLSLLFWDISSLANSYGATVVEIHTVAPVDVDANGTRGLEVCAYIY